jgi:hypothetical protein
VKQQETVENFIMAFTTYHFGYRPNTIRMGRKYRVHSQGDTIKLQYKKMQESSGYMGEWAQRRIRSKIKSGLK